MPRTIPHALGRSEAQMTVHTTTDGRTTTFVEVTGSLRDGSEVTTTGIARCAPGDTFDGEIGTAIALVRALRSIANDVEAGMIPEADRDPNPLVGVLTSRIAELTRENQELRAAADRNADAYIEATNPGIDMDEVRESRRSRLYGIRR